MPTRRRPASPTARFLLRLPPKVHRSVVRAAETARLSVNEYCVRRLRMPGPAIVLDADAQHLAEHARATIGDRLIGLILHGSVARGDERATSDVDVLVVVDASLPLTRALYRQWDAAPITWRERDIDAHFIHLPDDARVAGSVWCEAAIEGLTLMDADGRIDAALRRVRRAVADGRLVRRRVHGHPYWTKVA